MSCHEKKGVWSFLSYWHIQAQKIRHVKFDIRRKRECSNDKADLTSLIEPYRNVAISFSFILVRIEIIMSPPRQGRETYCFSLCVCPSVCLSVCLSVTNRVRSIT